MGNMGFILGGAIVVTCYGYLCKVDENVEPLEKRAVPQWAAQPLKPW